MGSHSLLQGIFLTQRLNPGLPHCRQILYRLSHQGNCSLWLTWIKWPSILFASDSLATEYFQAETLESSATVIHLVGSRRTTANLCLCRFKRSLCAPGWSKGSTHCIHLSSMFCHYDKVGFISVDGKIEEHTFFLILFLLVGGQSLHNIAVGFVIHWHESAMGLHVFPIPIPPPTSHSTRFLWVFPVHQAQHLSHASNLGWWSVSP